TQMFAPSKAIRYGYDPTSATPRMVPSLGRNSMTVSLPEFATQMLAPSKSTPVGPLPTGNVPCSAPSLARSFATTFLAQLATQMSAPSNAIPCGTPPTAAAPSTAPSLALIFVTAPTVDDPALATQTFSPSESTDRAPGPPGYLASSTASLPRTFTAELLPSKTLTQHGWVVSIRLVTSATPTSAPATGPST